MSSPIKQPTRPGISAVITSKKRKVQLGFDDDVLTEDRASSANQVPQGTSRVSSSQGTRPSTHEGLTPAPPTDKNKRTFRTVSPRHVSIKFLEHDDDLDSFEKLSPIKPPTVTITTNLERALAAAAVQPSHGIAMDDSVSSPTKSKSMPSEYQLPSFIKSTKTTSQLPSQAYGDSQSQQKLIIGDASMASMSLFSTQYPSLGHRLKANMGVDSIYQASPTKPPTTVISQRRYTPRGTADNSFKVSNWARKTQIERKLRGDASVSSQMFDCMDIEDMLAYLIDARDEQGNKVEFLHVTSRYHVERVTRTNFYDLVILERPGYPGSGYVWSRDHKKYRTHTHDVLPPHHVMQLSLQGLLVTSEDERIEPSELIFIQEFIMEKEQLEFLRSGRFFGLFKELKAFRAWKLYTQHSYVSRMKRILQKQTFFSDQELIQCIQYISETTYTLEIETDLFHFHGPGSMLISDFFTTQIQKLQDMSNTIQSQIELLGEKIAAQYHAYISSRKLEEMIQDVKDHHPLRTFMHTTETTTSNFFQTTGAFSPSAMDNTHTTGYDSPQSIDWVKFRSMQRLSDNFKQKIMQILYMAQFRMEYKIACIVEKFWLRMKQYFLGIYQLKTNRRVVNIEQQYQWEIDRNLFDAQGNLVLNENNDPYYQQLLHPKKKAASIVDQKSEEEVANKDEEEKFLAAVAVDEEDQDEVAIQKRVLLIEQQNKHKQYLKEIRELHSNDKVTADWQQQGSHLSIQVSLHVGEELRKMELEDLFGLSSNVIDQVKVVITPTKHDVLNHMHMLCGAMGKLLESLPNLKFHPLICSEETRHLYKRREAYGAKPEAQLDFTGVLEADEDQARVGMAEVVQALQKSMDDQDMEATSRANTAKATSKKKTIMSSHRHDNHQSSSNYFTFLIMSPVYNCRNSYQLAIDCIRYLFQSYQQASNVDSYRLKLLEIVRKLWALSPQTLIKQIERSFALTKIRDYVDNPELVEDLRRSQQRDRGRLSSYKTSLDYVDKLMEAQLYHFLDLKHSMGFVTSFQPVVKQLTMYKIIQENNLHIKLPHAFVTRCSLVYDFIRKLENSVESQQHLTNTTAASAVVSPRNMKGNNQNAPAPVDVMTYQQLLVCIQLMRRMKHFEEIKPYFDSEVDMIESMFQIMVEHQSKKAGKQQQTRSNTQNKTSSTVAELTSIDDRRERDYIMLEMQVEQGMTRYTHTQRYKSDMRGSLHKSAEAEAALQYSALPPEKLFKVFLEAIERLSITTSKTKSAILSLLHDMKRYILIHRQELHIQIQKVRGTLEDFQIVLPSYLAIEIKASTKKLQQKQLLEPTDQTPDLNGKPEKDEDEDDADDEKEIPGVRSVAEITQFINMTGKEVEKLRKASNECIAAQVILMEAHDIVGAANPILMSSEVSHFQDMDALEQEYSYRCEVWKVITEAEVIRRQLYSNKLGNPQAIVELNTSFLKILNKYNWLLLHIADPPETDSEVVLLEETVSAADELASITGAVVEVKEKKLPYSVLLLEPMKVIIEDVMPKMESAAYLSSKHLKGRHWQFLNIHSFLPSEMLLKFSGRQNEFISVIDIANTNNMIGNPSPASPTSTDIVDSLIGGGGGGGGLGLGNIHRLVLKELFSRHLHFYLQPMQYITSEAIMESVLESTLDSIEQTMRLSCIQTSTLWLRDSKLREKLFSEVNEIVNIIPLRVMVRYCWKAVCMVETTSQDMLLTAFDKRIERVKDFIYKVDYFLENYREIQYRWYYILVVIKFLPRNDIDRDMIRIYNNVTEDMKKVEVQLLQKNGNLYNTFASSLLTTPIAKQVNSNNKNGVVDTQEENTAAAGNSSGISSGASYDVMNTETMKLNLHYILEDVHSIIQSLLDACPRLSMLTYNKLMLLYRVWLFGPYVELAFVSECLHDMFPGVGLLHTVLLHGQKQYVCDGFESYHRLEMVRFLEVIPLTLPLEDFVTTFETSLRKVLEKSCDIMVVHRINCIKAMISDQQNDVIVQHLQSLFQIRINHLHALISNDHVNQCYQLTNMVSFAEDIWTCLGHPTGCLTMAKPDLLIENHLFLPRWRTSLQLFIDNCQENLVFLQDLMTSLQQVQDTSASSSSSPKKGLFYNGQDFDNLFSRAVTKNKAKQIISNFLLQEIHFMKIAHELLQCSCVESATEFWAGKFQIRFEYIKEHRYNYSPIDITLGNISLPYGMEYIEGGNVIVYSKELEYALGRVLSSAFALRGSTFIQKASNSSASEKGSTLTDALLIGTEGELMITCKDIALALGRISTTLSTASHSTNIRFFFSQLIYLDAIGGIDFTTISQDDLQLFIQIAQQFWLAIENKNDQFIQDSLKFPIKTKFTRNEVQSERRKQNLQQLRSTIMLKKERNIYFGFMFIGFASESEFTSMHVFDQFYRSIFDSISIDHAHSMQNLGIMLTSKGFMFGLDLEETLTRSMQLLVKYLESTSNTSPLAELKSDARNQAQSWLKRIVTAKELAIVTHLSSISLSLYPLTKFAMASSQQASASGQFPTGSSSASSHQSYSHRKIMRFYIELICFCGNLWDRLLHLSVGYVQQSTVRLIQQHFFTEFSNKLLQLLPKDEVEQFAQQFQQDIPLIQTGVANLLRKVATQHGYICNHDFLATCASLWESLIEQQSPFFILHGELSTGKSAVCEVVSKAMNIWRYRQRKQALQVMRRQVKGSSNPSSMAASRGGDLLGEYEYEHSLDHYNNSIVYGTVSNPVLCRIAAKKIFIFFYNWWKLKAKISEIQLLEESQRNLYMMTSDAPDTATSTKAAANTLSQSQTSDVGDGISRAATMDVDDNNKLASADVKNNGVTPTRGKHIAEIIPEAVSKSAGETPIIATPANEEQFVQLSSSKREKLEINAINACLKTTMIYHASMSVDALIGCFDVQGKWNDGILIRKLRHVHELAYNQKIKDRNQALDQKNFMFPSMQKSNQKSAEKNVGTSFHVIVFNGPMTYHIEQLLHGVYFQSMNATTSLSWIHSRFDHLTFPTGESHSIPKNVKILIETSDIHHASPACLAIIPSQSLRFTHEECRKRILTLWIRSLTHWLGDFPPWLDFIEGVHKLLLHTSFIEDLLYEDLNATTVSIAIITSKVTSFLKILEELLIQIHEMAIQQATFSIPEDREIPESESEEDEEEHEDRMGEGYLSDSEKQKHQTMPTSGTPQKNTSTLKRGIYKLRGIMSLHAKGREQLVKRGKLSIVYAALWGLGGVCNSSEKRKFFESMLRDLTQQYFDDENEESGQQSKVGKGHPQVVFPGGGISIPTEVSVYECTLSLEDCCFLPAYEYDLRSKTILHNLGLPEKYREHHIYCELLTNPKSKHDQLQFRSMNTRAVDAAIRLLLSAGSNVMLFGVKNCGKSKLIKTILGQLGSHCPTPDEMRQQIMTSLIHIINGTSKPEGIFRALEMLKSVLHRSTDAKLKSEFGDEFNRYWRHLASDLEDLWSGSPRQHCQQKTVSSCDTSIRSFSNAHGLRTWFEREFATETKQVLETSRFTYGVAFIDDMHYMSSRCSNAEDDSYHRTLNRPEELLRGMFNGLPGFALHKNSAVRSPASYGFHPGSSDGLFHRNSEGVPILHKEVASDLRFAVSTSTSDDMMLQRTTVVSAATGHFHDFLFHNVKNGAFTPLQSLVSSFSCISMPTFTISELHVALIAGSLVSMSAMSRLAEDKKVIMEVLKQEVVDLAKITMSACCRLISSNDAVITTPLERILRVCIIPDLSLVHKICNALFYGSNQVANPAGLLQLFSHEWKRFFLDPLPDGCTQRERVTTFFTEQIDSLDEKQWSVTREWLDELRVNFLSSVDKIWTNTNLLHSTNTIDQTAVAYKPVEYDVLTTSFLQNQDMSAFSDTITPDNKRVIDTTGFLSSQETLSILYPTAISLLLRMIRILTVVGKHILVSGYPGSLRNKVLSLAAKLCHLETSVFTPKDILSNTTDTPPTEKVNKSFTFKSYVKAVILRAMGLSDPITTTDSEFAESTFLFPGQVVYNIVKKQTFLMVVESAQQLNRDDRRILFNLIDYYDPSALFDDQEIQGMAEALRKVRKDSSLASSASSKTPDFVALSNADLQMSASKDASINPSESTDVVKGLLSSFQTRGSLTGYTFNWIRQQMKYAVRQQISIALLVELSRVHEVGSNAFYSEKEAVGQLRKLAGLHMSQGKSKTPTSASSTAHKMALKAKTGDGNKANTKAQESTGTTGNSKRYSLLSDRNQGRKGNREEAQNSIYNPASDYQQVIHAESYDTFQAVGGNGNSDKPAADHDGDTIMISAHSLFTCPILGPLLSRRFHFMWYDPPYTEAVQGICNTLLNPPRMMPLSIAFKPVVVGLYHVPVTLNTTGGNSNAPSAAAARRMSVADRMAVQKQHLRRNTFMKSQTPIASSTPNSNGDRLGSMAFTPISPNSLILEFATESLMSLRSKTPRAKTPFDRDTDQSMNFPEVAPIFDEEFNKQQILLNSKALRFAKYQTLSQVEYLGVFSAFAFPAEMTADISVLPVIQAQIEEFYDEASTLLPFLLQVALPCDAIFCSKPIYMQGIEIMTTDMIEYVHYLIDSVASQLIISQYIYQQVLLGYDEAIFALDNTEFMDHKLAEQNDELLQVARKLTRQIDQMRRELDNVEVDYQKTALFEQEMILWEDIASGQAEINHMEQQMTNLMAVQKRKILSFSTKDWQTFSILFTTKPYPKPMIDLMRAVMVLINYTPPKLAKKDSANSAGGIISVKMDDDMVARCSMSLLMKTNDFNNTLQNLNPANLTTVQINAIRIMNALLNTKNAAYLQADLYSVPSRYHLYHQLFANDVTTWPSTSTSVTQADAGGSNEPNQTTINAQNVHPIFDALRRFLIIVDLYVSSTEYVQLQRQDLESKEAQLLEIQFENDQKKNEITTTLKNNLEFSKSQLTLLDDTLQNNRKKLDIIDRNRNRKEALSQGLSSARSFAASELSKVSKSVESFVMEGTIAVVVMYRLGHLPDYMRQHCAEILRQEVAQRYSVKHYTMLPGKTTNALLLGQYLDGIQCRQWLACSEQSLPNDVPSLNCMTLLYLSPLYTMVIDPDGSALGHILEAIPKMYNGSGLEHIDGHDDESDVPAKVNNAALNNNSAAANTSCVSLYETSVITGQKFTIPWLESLVQSLNVAVDYDDGSFFFNNTNRGNNSTIKDNSNDITSSKAIEKGLYIIVTDVQSGVSEDLICFLSAAFTTTVDGNAVVIDSKVRLDQMDQYGMNTMHRTIYIPKKFRIVLLTSQPPTLDSLGNSYPLPMSCLQNLHMIHWTTAVTHQMYVEKAPIAIATEHSFANEHTMLYRLGWELNRFISASNLEQLVARNQCTTNESLQLLAIERNVTLLVFQWMKLEHDSTTRDFKIDGLIEQSAISLSILSNEDIIQFIIKANPKREHLQRLVRLHQALFRENLTYFSAYQEVFTMSVDYLRMCQQFIPLDLFAPYSLTSGSLVNHFLPLVIRFAKKLSTVAKTPPSLFFAWKVWRAISSIQMLFRRRRQPQESNKPHAPSSGSQSEYRRPSSFAHHHRILSSKANSATGTSLPTYSNISGAGGSYLGGGGPNISIQQYYDEANREIAYPPYIRRRAIQVVHYKLLPLRTLFLREMVRYLQINIRPGLENILKMLLILTTWTQSDAVPVEEIRALMYMMLESKGLTITRYCHFLDTKSTINGSNANINVNLDTNPSAPVDSSPVVHNRRSRQVQSNVNMDKITEDDDDDHKPPSLENSPLVSGRKNTPSRPTSSKLRRSNASNTSSADGTDLPPPSNSYYDRFLERGATLPDGLWLNKRSTKYTAALDNSAMQMYKTNPSGGAGNPSQQASLASSMNGFMYTYASSTTSSNRPRFLSQLDQGITFFSDEHLYITTKSRLLRMDNKSGDTFEIEWLRSKGVKTFSVLNYHAVLALGATLKAAEEIQKARQTLMQNMQQRMAKRNTLIKGKPGHRISIQNKPAGNEDAHRRTSQRRKSSMRSLYSHSSVVSQVPSGAAAGKTSNAGQAVANATASNRMTRRLTNRASNLLENMTSNVRSTRKMVLSSRMTNRWSRRQSTAINVSSGDTAKFAPLPQKKNNTANATHQQLGIGQGSDFSELVYDPQAYLQLLILETHPALAPIFRGITSGIQRNILDFVEWKENLVYLESIDSKKLEEDELISLLQGILPPKCTDLDEHNFGLESAASQSEEGMWAKGFELTIIQSWLLCEALWPGSAANMMDVMYTLLGRYLSKDGYMILHKDEKMMDEEDIMNVDEDRLNELVSGQDGDDSSGGVGNAMVQRKTVFSSAKPSATIREEDEDDSDVDQDASINSNEDSLEGNGPVINSSIIRNSDNRSSFFKNLENYSKMVNTYSLQDNVPVVNSWSKLLHLVTLPSNILTSYGPELKDPWSATALSCRDYHNWELVVYEMCLEYAADVDKFVFMKELRETLFMSKRQMTYFLLPTLAGSQNAVFSQRVRDYAIQSGGKQIPIIYCTNGMSTAGNSTAAEENVEMDKKMIRGNINEVVKTIKSAIAMGSIKKAILEMVDLESASGNAILNTVLANPTNASSLPPPSAGTISSGVNTFTSTNSSLKDNYPLVISSPWSHHRSASRHNAANETNASTNQYYPSTIFSDFSFAWLPRFFPPDIIRKYHTFNHAQDSIPNILKAIEEPPSLPESCGILYEELESTLIWVMNSTRTILQTRVTPEIQSKLKRMNKLEIRVTSAVVTIWQMVSYMRSRRFEEQGVAGEWSSCLNAIPLWPLSRLMLKICEIMQSMSLWQQYIQPHADVKTNSMLLMLQDSFQQGIRSILESFSRMDSNYYIPGAEDHKEEMEDKGDDDDEDDVSTATNTVASKPTPAVARSNSPLKGVQKLKVAVGKLIINDEKSSPSKKSKHENKNIASFTNEKDYVIHIQHLQQLLQQKKGSSNTSSLKVSQPQILSTVARLRAQKQWKKTNRKLEDARLQYLEFLQRQHRLIHGVPVFKIISHPMTKQKNLVDQESNQRLYSFLAHYIAETISTKFHQQHLKKLAALERVGLPSREDNQHSSLERQTSGRRLSVQDAASFAVNARRHSNKMNITSVLSRSETITGTSNPKAAEEVKASRDRERREHRKTISSHIDVMFGSLLPRDLMVCMVDWTIDAHPTDTESGRPPVDRRKVLKSIKILADHVLQGKVVLQFPPANTDNNNKQRRATLQKKK